MQNIDILIKNCYIATFDENYTCFEDGFIAINKNKIIDLGKTENCNYTATKTINAKGKIAMPGLINMHTHLAMTALRGYADDLPLKTWLEQYIWPAEQKMVCAESVYKASVNGIVELFKNGISCFNDMYFYEQQTADVAKRLGIRAYLSEGVLDFDPNSTKTSTEKIEECCKAHKQYCNDELITFCFGPHSVYVCSEDDLKRIQKSSKNCNIMVHIHASESKHEVNECLKKHGKTPIAYLNDLGLLNDKALLAHCVWITDEDMDLIKNANASILVNTKSNLKLASGILPLQKIHNKGINYCLGTDSVASNNRLSILSEANITALLHKGVNLNPESITAKQILTAATKNAAKALKLKTGQLTKDYLADVLLIDCDDLEFLPKYDVYSYIVYSINEKAINSLIVNGKIVMENQIVKGVTTSELKENLEYLQKKLDFNN